MGREWQVQTKAPFNPFFNVKANILGLKGMSDITPDSQSTAMLFQTCLLPVYLCRVA